MEKMLKKRKKKRQKKAKRLLAISTLKSFFSEQILGHFWKASVICF